MSIAELTNLINGIYAPIPDDLPPETTRMIEAMMIAAQWLLDRDGKVVHFRLAPMMALVLIEAARNPDAVFDRVRAGDFRCIARVPL